MALGYLLDVAGEESYVLSSVSNLKLDTENTMNNYLRLKLHSIELFIQNKLFNYISVMCDMSGYAET